MGRPMYPAPVVFNGMDVMPLPLDAINCGMTPMSRLLLKVTPPEYTNTLSIFGPMKDAVATVGTRVPLLRLTVQFVFTPPALILLTCTTPPDSTVRMLILFALLSIPIWRL